MQGAKQPLFIAFIDLTKAFDLVSRDGLFKILPKIGCPPKLLSIIRSFHEDMKGTVVFDGSTAAAFNIRSGGNKDASWHPPCLESSLLRC